MEEQICKWPKKLPVNTRRAMRKNNGCRCDIGKVRQSGRNRPLLSSRHKIGSPAFSIVAVPHCGNCSFSNDLTSDETSATGGRQRFARNLSRRSGYRCRFNPLLASVDSLTSFSPSVNAPLGHHSDHSPDPIKKIACVCRRYFMGSGN